MAMLAKVRIPTEALARASSSLKQLLLNPVQYLIQCFVDTKPFQLALVGVKSQASIATYLKLLGFIILLWCKLT